MRLLFIDRHKDWLDFVRGTLSKSYDVVVATEFDILYRTLREGHQFDLIFIGLNLAQENIEALSDIAQSSMWRFIVLFPGFPDRTTTRIFFKAGMRDLLSKPYDAASLKQMVEEEIEYVREHNGVQKKSEDDKDYASRVRRLWESVQTTLPPHS